MNDDTSYLDLLNSQQRAAVEYLDGPQLVIAGAGSGKTRVLTYKIVHLLRCGYPPYRIMALTFTNKAAREMRQRIEALVGDAVASQLWMGTFHSIFARILRYNAERLGYRHDYTIYDAADSKSAIKLAIKELGLDDKIYRPGAVQARISNMKNALFSAEEYARQADFIEEDQHAEMPDLWRVFATYDERCRVAGAMDFDDLLFNTNVLLRDFPDVRERYQTSFQYILVDEYQDTNFAQYMILRQLCEQHRRLCVVGDDAQSIYSFRGAQIGNILNMERVFKDLKTFKLERNYRSTQNIIEAANSLIAKNVKQIPKKIYSENEPGSRIDVLQCLSDYEEAYVVANHITAVKARTGCSFEDFAVLYRTNAQSRVLEEALSNGGRRDKHGNTRRAIPYRIYGGLSFYQRKEVKDAICYMRLVTNPDDDEALRRIINYPPRGIGDVTVGKIQLCAHQNKVSMWAVLNSPDQYGLAVNRGTRSKLEAFALLLKDLATMNGNGQDAHAITEAIFKRTRLIEVLSGDKTPENISRIENLEELRNSVREFVDEKREGDDDKTSLADYLAETSLLTDQDGDSDKDVTERVTLMTIHAAKGLEYDHVIIVGVEQDLLPSYMSVETPDGIEEERRLFYVAITRARKSCMITHAQTRYRNGETRTCKRSPFIDDIDPRYLRQSVTSPTVTATRHDSTDDRRNEWNRVMDEAPAKPKPSLPPAQFKPLSKAKPLPAADTGDGMTTHTADELCEGLAIHHSKFGRGVITKVEKGGNGDKIVVEFELFGQRTMLLQYARFKFC